MNLKNSKIMLILSISLILLVIGSVSATEDIDEIGNETVLASMTDVDTVETVDDMIFASETTDDNSSLGVQESVVLGLSEDSILKDSDDESFSDLAYLIKLTDDELVLSHDYTYSDVDDRSYLTSGITISKNNFVIDGADHTIDGNWLAKAFTITGKNVTLKNLKITHCVESVIWSGDDGNLIKCSFSDNIHNSSDNSNRGAGVLWSGSNANVSGCIFNNMTGQGGDGFLFIKFTGINVNLEYTTFANSSNDKFKSERMAVFFDASAVGINTIKKCNFLNVDTSYSTGNSGILFIRGCEATVDECYFLNCSAWVTIVYSTGTVSVKNSKFVNVSATGGRGYNGVIVTGAYLVSNCSFVNQIGGNFVLESAKSIVDCNFTNTLGLIVNNGQVTGSKFENMKSLIIDGYYVSFLNCIFKDTDLSDNDYLIKFTTGSNILLENNTFSNNVVKTALVYIEDGVTCNVANLVFENNNAPENIINKGAPFVDSSNIFVCENGAGDGFSRFSPTNLENALSIVSAEGTITIINGTHDITGAVTFNCDIIGEDNVIINAYSMTLSKFRSIKGVTFNQTFQLALSAHNTLTNVNFTNPISSNSLIYSNSALHTKLTNIGIINGDFNDGNVFAFATSMGNLMLMGAWTLDNLTIINCDNINNIFYTSIMTMSSVNNITVKNTTFNRLLYDSGAYISSSSSFNHVNVSECNVKDYLFYTSFNEKCSDLSFNHITIRNVNCSSGDSFIRVNYNSIFDDLVIDNLISSNSNLIVIDLYNGKNIIRNSKFNNIINSSIIISNSGSCTLDNVNITSLTADYGINNTVSTSLSYVLFRDCTFTNSIVNLDKNSHLDYCTFNEVSGSVNASGNNVIISKCKFNKVNSINGAVNIEGENCLISNSNFTNNLASENGGAIHINANSSQIMNTQFSNNRAEVHGGAIFVHSDVFYYLDELSTTLPEETSAAGDSLVNGLYRIGYIPTYSIVYIDPNVAEHDNYRNTLSSAFSLVNPNGIIESLNGNDVYEIDAGMHDFAKSNVTLIGHNTIVNVSGYLTISDYASVFTVRNIIFQGSPDHVFVWKGENGKIINCTFQDNIVSNDDGYGAALDIEAKNMQIINTAFKNNRIESSVLVGGAAIYLNSTDLIIDNCTFDGNVANIASSIYIVDTSKNILINKSRFINNVAFNNNGQFGGILSYGSNIDIIGCVFENNAVSGGKGAALVFNSVVGIVNLESNEFINNSATQGGAIYFVNCPKYTSNDNKFIDNVATQGGAIYVSTSGLTFIGENFTYNTATNGGAIYVDASNFGLLNCTFKINTATNGGAVYINALGVSLVNCNFTSNKATVDGGAIELTDNANNTYIENCNFDNNTAKYGAAIANWNSVMNHINVIGSNFTNNSALGGGAIQFRLTTASIIGSKFINNNATANGGAFYIVGGSIVDIDDSDFINNTAISNGGVFHGDNSEIAVISSRFNNNNATGNGGAVYLNHADKSQVENCNFTNCVANGDGGAIYNSYSSNMLVKNSKFIKNRASQGSAVLSNCGNCIIVSRCTFEENNATSGATFNFYGITLKMYWATFKNNVANTIAGVLMNNAGYNTDSCVAECNFINNHAKWSAGAIYIANSPNATVISSIFENNTANNGGAIYIASPDVIITSSKFIGNKANQFGGAIYVDGNNVKVMGCEFKENKAENGSAIYIKDTVTSATIIDSIFIGNNATEHGTVYLKGITSPLKLSNNIFTGNSPVGAIENYYIDPVYTTSSVVYVNSTGGGSGLTWDDPTSWDDALIHLENPGKIVIVSDITIAAQRFTNQNVTITSYGDIRRKLISNGKYIFTLQNSNLVLKNVTLDAGVTVGSGSSLSMDNVTFTAASGNMGISFASGSTGSIINSKFVNNKNIDHALIVDGTVNINNTVFANNTLVGSALYYGETGSGSVTYSTFTNNTAANDVRNINITDISQVTVKDNTIDAILKDINISRDVYGEDLTINGTLDAGVNFQISGITLTLNDTLTTNRTVTVNDATFTTTTIDGGVLGADTYNVTADSSKSANNYVLSYSANEFTINYANIAADVINGVEVTYGNGTITIKGKFNQTGTHVNYTGQVVVSITGVNGTAVNNSVHVSDGEFTAVIVDGGLLGAGKYNVTVAPNSNSDNQNYTVGLKEFSDKVVVKKADVQSNWTADADVIYGMNDTITVVGTFNASSGANAKNYSGIVTVTISNGVYSIENATVEVKNGRFTAVLTDQGRLGHGTYNVTVSPNAQSVNANYTVSAKTFENKVTVQKASVNASGLDNIEAVVYAINDTITVVGTFNASSGVNAKNYTGSVSVTISNGVYSIVNTTVEVKNGKFTAVLTDQGQLGYGTYNVIVSNNGNSDNENYTVTTATFNNVFTVNKATVSANESSKALDLVYGVNDTITITGTFNASAHDNIGYNGNVTVIISGNNGQITLNNVKVENGEFRAVLTDQGRLGAGDYNITVNNGTSSENYTVGENIFKNHVKITPRTVEILEVGDITVVYGNNQTVNVVGKVNATKYGANYTGLLNVSIKKGDTVFKNNNTVYVESDDTFSVSIDVSNLGVSEYDILVEGQDTSNYTVKEAVVKILNVTQANITINDINEIVVVYGRNNVTVSGNIASNIIAGLGANYTGSIVITIEGTSHTYKIDSVDLSGKFSYTFDLTSNPLNQGNYNITVNVTGNGNYSQVNRTFIEKLNVLKANVTINDITVLPVVYGNNRTVNITGSVTSDILFGTAYNGNVTIMIEGNKYSHAVNSDGTFSFLVPIEYALGNGTYDVNVTVDGNGNYNGKERIFGNALSVNPADLTINHSITVSDVTYWDTFVDIAGNVVSNINHTYGVNYTGKITVFIDDTAYSNATTVVKPDGTFSVRIYFNNSLNAGSYNITVKVNDDSSNVNYTSDEYTFENNLTVNPRNINIIDVGCIEIVYGNNKTVNVIGKVDTTEHGENYTGLLNVSIMINDQVYRFNNTVNVKSDGTFSVSVDVDSLGVGNYTILVEGAKTNNYIVNSNNTAKLNVTKAKVIINDIDDIEVVYGRNNVTVRGNVASNIGAGLGANYTGSIVIAIDGTSYTYKIDSVNESGVFSYTFDLTSNPLNQGNYNITVNVTGNDNYDKVNRTFIKGLSVLKANVTINQITVLPVVYGNNRTVNVAGSVTSDILFGNNYDSNVTVVIEGNKYSHAVNSDGTFSFLVPIASALGNGNYDVNITVDGNGNYNGKERIFDNNLTVNPAQLDIVHEISLSEVIYWDTFVEITGNVVSNIDHTYGVNYTGKISVFIDDTTYSNATTVVKPDGTFSVRIYFDNSLDVGTYNITVKVNDDSSNVNYTSDEYTFVNNLTVKPRTINITEVNDITVVYGNNQTVNVVGKVNTTRIGQNYTGKINITIRINDTFSITGEVNAENCTFTIPIDVGSVSVGDYDILVDGAKTDNYVVNSNYTAKLHVTQANVTINDITLDKIVYGTDQSVVVYGTVTSNIPVSDAGNYTGDVIVSINGYDISNSSNVYENGSFVATLRFDVLAVGSYTLNVTVVGNTNYKANTRTFADNLTVLRANVTVSFDGTHVIYGMNNTIVIEGSVSKAEHGVRYNGTVCVVIGENTYKDIEVVDGKFNLNVPIKDYSAGNYTTNITEIAQNDNYTFEKSEFVFGDNVVVDVANVTVTFEGANVTYGEANEITIKGYVSNSTYGVAYSGKVNVTIGDRHYNDIEVENGNFTVIISDIADYDAGKYDVSVVEAKINNNYTFNSKTFTFSDNVTVNKCTVDIISVEDITVVYGNNNTVNVTGRLETVEYGDNYTGLINVTIYGESGTANAVNGAFTVEINNIGKFDVKDYEISVYGENTTNYNYVALNNAAKLHVTQANVTINDITLDKIVYGTDQSVEIYGTITNNIEYGINYTGEVTVSISGYEISNTTTIYENGSFVATLRFDVLAVGSYTLKVTVVGNTDYKGNNRIFTDNLTVLRANVTVSFDGAHVIYGMNNTIVIEGSVSKAEYGVGYNGTVCVVIGENTYDNVKVVDGKFNITVPIKDYSAGNYTTNITEIAQNDNYTFEKSEFVFEDNVVVDVANVTVTFEGANVTYGDANEIIIKGYVSNSTYGVVYSGKVNVTIGDRHYNDIEVENGNFTVIISDIADYDAGMYDVSVVEALINSNYTFHPKTITFNDNITINKRTINIISVEDIRVVYGNNNTVNVVGKVNTIRNGVNYTGIITAVIKDKDGNVYTGSANAGNGEFSVPVDITGINAGEYIINVTGASDSNYTAISANTDTSLNVARANVIIAEIVAEEFIYGVNNTVVIAGTVTNAVLGENYTGYINVTIDGTEYFQNKVNVSKDGSFKFEITLDDSYINYGNYNLTVTLDGDDNYNKTSATSIGGLKVKKATITITSVDNITVLYGENNTVHITGKLDTVTYGDNYTGNITVIIKYLDGSVVLGNASASNGTFDVTINGVQYWNVSTYIINVTGQETTNYNAICENTDAKFTVIKNKFPIEVSVVGVSEGNVKVDQNATVSVTGILDHSTGNVTITVTDGKGKEYIIYVPAESYTIYLDVIDTIGTYTLTAKYMGDNNYNASDIIKTFTVTKWNATDLQNLINEVITLGNSTVTLEHDYEFGDDQSVPVDINASITIDGNDHTVDANGTDGIFNITTGGVTIENITLTGVENGTAIKSIGANTIISNMILTNSKGKGIELNGDNSTVENLIVRDSTGTAVEVIGDNNSIDNVYANNYAGTIVSVNGDRNNVTNTVATDGNSTVVDVAGGNNNTVSNITSTGNAGKDLVDNGINTRKSGISPGSADKVFDLSKANANPAVFAIKLPADATGTFTVTVGGKNYTAEVKKGSATITVSGLSSGSQNVSVSYSGDAQYKGLSKTSTITVPTSTKQSTVLTFAKKKYTFKKSKRSKTKTFKATLKTKAGVKLAGKTVLLKLTKVNKIKLSAKVKKAIKKAKAKVNKAKKAYKKSKTAKAKKALDNAKKALIKAKKPQTMLKQLKKGTYAVKTNKNGLVKLTLSKKSFNMKKFKGKVKLVATFKGDSSYLKSSKTVNIVIK